MYVVCCTLLVVVVVVVGGDLGATFGSEMLAVVDSDKRN